jgi:signal transduction histidine kinase
MRQSAHPVSAHGTTATRLLLVVVLGGWAVLIASLAAGIAIDLALHSAGYPELAQTLSPDAAIVNAVFAPALLSAAAVGSALASRKPGHPVGWLFLALAVVVAWSSVAVAYAAYGLVARPGSLPAADMIAVYADRQHVFLLMLLALILHLTPHGRPADRLGKIGVWAAIVGAVISFGAGLLRPYRGEFAALAPVANPLELRELTAPLSMLGVAGIVVLQAAVIAGPLSLVLRYRSAKAEERRQLRWLALAGVPLPALVIGAWFAASVLGNQFLVALLAGGYVAVVPVAVALAIERHGLYDIDHLLSRGLTYALLTAVLLTSYAVVVVVAGALIARAGGDAQLAAVVATLAAVSVAGPVRQWLQDQLDRRFTRRRFDAVSTIRRYVQDPSPSMTIEQALRRALGDADLSVAYWIDDSWVTEAGAPTSPGDSARRIARRGLLIAAVSFDTAQVDQRTLATVIVHAQPELENARLRAAIARQLVEVRQSRARIVAAQAAERSRIERNLHDGAQQRLLAVAFQLRAAELSRNPDDTQRTIAAAVEQLQSAVRELRELANGLHPSAIAGGGLAAALDDLAGRTPVPVRLEASPERFAPVVEEAAWFIACEAVANAVKHAAPRSLAIRASRANGHLQLIVEDDGSGGADPAGHGLRGIADRAEAAGGRLIVSERPGGGTRVMAELPCGS